MLKKYTSNKILSLMNNNDKNEGNHSAAKTKKIKKSIKLKNSEEKNNSQIKNSIFNKVIIKSNSIINNNNEHYLLNYKNKMSIKNSSLLPKNLKQTKNKNHLKGKIKTTFSNYYTDFIFKNSNNIKPNFNITEINFGMPEDTDDFSHIRLNNETNEDSLKTNRLKYLGLYNTDSSQKINFNTYINNPNNSKNNSKDNSPFNKGSILISPNRKKINKEKKKILVNSNKKIPKIRLAQNSENKNNNSNINNSNKNLKSYGNDYKKQKNIIKSQKTNKYLKIKREEKKIDVKNKERNKENKIKMFDSSNKALKKNNITEEQTKKHIFLSPLQKNINSIIVKKKSSTKKINKINYNNYLSHYNTTNSLSNKENKKIIFQRKENIKPNGNISNKSNSKTKHDKNKQTINNIIITNNNKENIEKEKFTKFNLNTHNNVLYLKDDLEVNNIETDINKLMDEHKELTPSIVSEDKKTEKDLYLEKNNNNVATKDKNLIDYFKTARKALKTMSHSLIDPINNSNNIFNDNEIKNYLIEAGQISNRYKEDELHNYTIKRVPIFMGVNMFPRIKNKYCNITLNNIFSFQSKDKYINIKKYIINFLDDKSIMYFSCVNKILFKNIRNNFLLNIYNQIYKNKKFVKKINDSLFKIVCKQLNKNKYQLKLLYDSLPSKTSYNDIILNDLYRTFPEDSKFHKNATNYKKLYNILTKYSNYNPIIGYAQGLNFFFANSLYLYENEISAFFYIDGLIRRFDLVNFLAEKNSKLTSEINKFSKILSKYNLDILNYFDENLINHDFFTNDWILTLFSNSMNNKNLLICWNFMIVFGWKFFYCFVIQILAFYKTLIFKTKDNALSQLMKNILKEKQFSQDLPKIINNTLKFMKKFIVL